MRRILRIATRVLLALTSLGVALLIAAAIFLQTDCGQERVRRWAEARLERSVRGDASIEKARLTLGGHLDLEGVVIRDATGAPVIVAGKVSLEFDWLPLLRKRLHAGRVVVDALEASASVNREGEVDIATLFRTDEEPSDWTMTFGTLELTRSRVSLRRESGAPVTLADLEARGTARVSPAGAAIHLQAVSATWLEEALPVSASARLRLDHGTYTGRHVVARVGDLELAGTWVRWDAGTGLVAAPVWLRGPSTDLRRLPIPELRSHWQGDLAVLATVHCSAPTSRCRVRASGELGDGTADIAAELDLDRPSVVGFVALTRVTPASVIPGSPNSRIEHLELRGAVAGRSLDTLLGVVDAHGSGAYETTTVNDATVHLAAPERGRFVLRFASTTDRGQVDGSAVVRRQRASSTRRQRAQRAAVGPRPGDEAWLVERSRLHAELPGLEALVGSAPIRGRAEVTLTAHGPATSLAVAATADLWDGSAKSARVRRLHVNASASGVSALEPPEELAGEVSLWARGAATGSHVIGDVEARGTFADFGRRLRLVARGHQLRDVEGARSRLTVRIDPTRTTIGLDGTVLEAGGTTWRGAGGTVVVRSAGRVELEGLDLSSAAGRVQASGSVDPHGDSARAQLKVGDLALARVPRAMMRALGLDAARSGQATADAVISRTRGAIAIDGSARVRRFVWGAGATPVDVVAELHTAPDSVSASATVTAPHRGGRAHVSARLRGPSDLFDRASWQRLSLADTERAELTLTQVSVPLAAEILGRDLPISGGRVTGKVELPPAAPAPDGPGREPADRTPAAHRSARVDLSLTGMRVADLGPLGAQLAGWWSERGFDGSMGLQHRGKPVFSGPLRVGMALSDLWTRPPAEWASRSLSGHAELSAFELARIPRAGLTPVAMTGKLSGVLVLGGTLSKPTVELRDGSATGVRVAGVSFQRVTLAGNADRAGLSATVRADQTAGGHLRGRASYQWGAHPRLGVRANAVGFDLRALRETAYGAPELLADLAGKLDGSVRLTGWPDAPVVTGRASITTGEITLEGGARHVSDLSLVARFEPGKVHIERLEARPGGGHLSAKGTVHATRLLPDRFTLKVTTKAVPLTVGSTRCAADLGGNLTGRIRDGRIAATATVRRGSIRLWDVDRDLQSLSPLEDVVFLREGKPPDTTDSLGPADIELHVRVPENVRVQSETIDALLKADLRLAFTDGRTTRVAGTVDVLSGSYELLDRRYRIRRGHAELDGAMPPNPELDIELWRQFPADGVRVTVSGSFADPRAVLSTDSGRYDDTQTLIIMLGEDPDDPEIANRPFEDRALGAAGAILSRQVKKRLRVVDVLRAGNDSVEIGRWVTDDLMVGYRERYSSDERENPREFTFEYRLLRRVMIEGRYGANITGGDLVWIINW